MPEYTDLVRRSLAAREQSTSLQIDSRRISALAQILRDAQAGDVLILHCAWCDRLKVGDEWLHLEAIGRGQQRIAASVRDQATHGICPNCFEQVQTAAEDCRDGSA
jgi:hypothetical protein